MSMEYTDTLVPTGKVKLDTTPEFYQLIEELTKQLNILEEHTHSIEQKISVIQHPGDAVENVPTASKTVPNGILGQLWECRDRMAYYNSCLGRSNERLGKLVGFQ